MKQSKAGGKRPGAGRPKGEKKKALGLRVPEKHHAYLTEVVRKEIAKLDDIKICKYCGNEGWRYALNGNIRKCRHC